MSQVGRPKRRNRASNASRSNQRSNRSKAKKSVPSSKKSFNQRLAEEHRPPFALEEKWSPESRIKVKLENPFVAGEMDEYLFPILSHETKLSERALFYKEVVDLKNIAQVGESNVPLLYHILQRCLRDQALVDWTNIVSDRDIRQATLEEYNADVDRFLTYHDSRDPNELIHAQKSYFSKIRKPVNMSPSEFRNCLLRLNNLILAIPGATEEDKIDADDIKYIFVEAMPPTWKLDFRKIGKRVRNEELDELVHFFDVHHESSPTPSETPSKDPGSRSQSQHSNSSSASSKRKTLQPDDPCPIHGGSHKWNDCFDNKHGPNFRPPSSNRRGTSGTNNNNNNNNRARERRDNHYQASTNEESSNANSDHGAPPSDRDENPYEHDDYNFEHVSGIESKDNNDVELVPMTIVEGHQGDKVFAFSKVLFDSGGSRCGIFRSSIPKGCKVVRQKEPFSTVTSSGVCDHYDVVKLPKLVLPEFTRSRWIENVEFIVFDNHGHSAYDMIIGRDVLEQAGIDVKFSSKEISWDEYSVPFHRRSQPVILSPSDPIAVQKQFAESYMSVNALVKKKTDGDDIAQNQTHLEPQHRTALAAMLAKHEAMWYNRSLGEYKGTKVELKLIPGVHPIKCKPFPIPHRHLKEFKRLIDTLVLQDILEPVLATEWCFPSFLVPKKNGEFRFVSDFRRLNAVLVDFTHDLPKIKDVLQRRNGFDYVTVIDITSQFYHFVLDEKSRKYAVITTPFGRYRYKRLPMGIKIAPSFAQAVMNKLFSDMGDTVECFIDDIAVFTKGTYEEHVSTIDEVLRRLNIADFSIRLDKCHFAVQEVEYLGHIITPHGVKPQPKKVSAILNIASPRTPKQLRQFVGMINYYRDHIHRRSHLLAPMTAQTKNKKHLHWDELCEKNFQALKSLLAQDCLLAYPDPSFVFVIEPDASDYQLGSIVLQNTTHKHSVEEIIKLFTSNPSQLPTGFRPIAYFSRKLSAAQRNYVTLEKELLSIVETLIEYRSVLLGSPIVAFTDHRNLTFNTNQSQRALRWRLLMEEYNIHLVHRSGSSNHATGALYRLPLLEPEEPISVRQAQARFDDAYHFYPVQNRMQNPSPVSFPTLQRHQRADASLQRTARTNPAIFRTVEYGTSSLIQSRQHPNSQSWRIVVPIAIVNEVIKWFHDTLMHPGVQRMLQTIRKHFYFPQMRRRVEEYVKRCDSCQRTKNHHDRAGLLPPKDPETGPWYEVQVDLMGPWQVDVGYNYRLTIHALSCVDPFTGYIEIVRVSNTLSAHVSSKFHNHWLCRYPTPSRCIHDNGPEFIGHEFQDVLRYYGIKDVPTTSKNPQANSIVERAHQTIASMLRNMSYETRTDRRTRLTAEDIDDFIETALSCTQRAINATVHTVTKETPGVLAFHRDMLLPIQVVANWELTRERCANSITRNVLRENSTRRPFNWQPGMQVLISVPGSKIDPKFAGPYTITQVHPNGTVTIRRRPNTFQRINIRRIKLYHAPRV